MDWTKTLVASATTLHNIIRVIDEAVLQIALVVDEQQRLLGTITDGDIRRALLRGATLETKASDVMNRTPTVVAPGTPGTTAERLMQNKSIRRIPVVDELNRVVGLVLPQQEAKSRLSNEVVLMAGGLGTRLGKLTEDVPKPLLRVGTKPILETIVESFLAQGFYRFKFAVNYKAALIKDHFGDGTRWGAEIEYLHETERLGTAGALSLMESPPKEPFFVMNGDLLTKVNFEQMLHFHQHHKPLATMAVREYDLQVPFGVVELNGHAITALAEKPVHRFFVNAGIYVLSPECLGHLTYNAALDITDLFQKLLDNGEKAASFPVHEYWLDIGRVQEYEEANTVYETIFP